MQKIFDLTFIGNTLSPCDDYSRYEKECYKSVARQIDKHFKNQINLLINLTWFGPQFNNEAWHDFLELESTGAVFDNIFLLATVDPCYLTVTEQQEVKNKVKALRLYQLGNFDGPYQFNFFAPIIAENFKSYSESDLILEHIDHVFVNYNRKPKRHRVEFVKRLIDENLLDCGIVTLGHDETNDLHLTLGEDQKNYVGTTESAFGIPMDYYSLHRLDLWKKTFLCVVGATEFNPVNDLFCQQDTFKPMIGMRPFVFNGVQKTYRWLRHHGFRTFNHYWPHISIEDGDVHGSIIELIKHLRSIPHSELQAMYADMLPDLRHNKKRFFEFAKEQKYKMENLF